MDEEDEKGQELVKPFTTPIHKAPHPSGSRLESVICEFPELSVTRRDQNDEEGIIFEDEQPPPLLLREDQHPDASFVPHDMLPTNLSQMDLDTKSKALLAHMTASLSTGTKPLGQLSLEQNESLYNYQNSVKWLNDNDVLRLDSTQKIEKILAMLHTINANSVFLNLSASLMLTLAAMSPALDTMLMTLVKNTQNPDLVNYVFYIKQRQQQSFHISSIHNPFVPKVSEVKNFSLLRLAICKDQLAKIFLVILQGLCCKRSFSNSLRLYTGSVQSTLYEKRVSHTPLKKYTCCQSKDLNADRRLEFLNRHIVQKWADSETYSCIAAQELDYDYVHAISHERTLVFSPLKGFNFLKGIQSPNSLPYYYECAAQGGILVGEGGTKVWDPVKKETTYNQPAVTLKDLSPYLKLANLDDVTGKMLWMDEVSLNFYLNNPEDEGVLRIQTIYTLLDQALAPQNRPTLYKDKVHSVSRSSKEANLVCSHFNSHQLLNEETVYQCLASCLKNKESFLMEPLVIMRNLAVEDDWSIYFKWEAYEASPYIIALYGVASYLAALAAKALSNEKKKLHSLTIKNADARLVAQAFIDSGLL